MKPLVVIQDIFLLCTYIRTLSFVSKPMYGKLHCLPPEIASEVLLS